LIATIAMTPAAAAAALCHDPHDPFLNAAPPC
jgi:hypothetical protein